MFARFQHKIVETMPSDGFYQGVEVEVVGIRVHPDHGVWQKRPM